jgi:hypothetical protein
MNSSGVDSYDDPENVDGFAYSIGFSIGVVVVIVMITAASYYCTRRHALSEPSNHGNSLTSTERSDSVIIDVGLDEAALRSFPKFLYSQAKLHKGDSTASCCSICLADYKNTDMLRLLPDCGHLFHRKCVDPWLRLHPTCPVCRNSPAPTPLPTPLAEIAPLAGRRD